MDPNATLKEIRALMDSMVCRERGDIAQRDTLHLVDLVTALDEWLTKGGFSPEPWKKASRK